MRQLDEMRKARSVAADPGLRAKTPMESAAEILIAAGQRGNLNGLGPWATKAELVLATGRSRDFFERADRAGRLPSRVEVVPGARRLRTLYQVEAARQLLEAAR
jgi:hypothetical protein